MHQLGACEKACQKLKEHLCKEPVLSGPNFSEEFILQTDISEVGLGAVLFQETNGE